MSKVSLAFAWESADAPAGEFNVSTDALGYEMSPLLFEYALQTGKLVGQTPGEVGYLGSLQFWDFSSIFRVKFKIIRANLFLGRSNPGFVQG